MTATTDLSTLRAAVDAAEADLSSCQSACAQAVGVEKKRAADGKRIDAKERLRKARVALRDAEAAIRAAEKNDRAAKRAEDAAEKKDRADDRAAAKKAKAEAVEDAKRQRIAAIAARAAEVEQGMAEAGEFLVERFIYGGGREQWYDREHKVWRGARAFDQIAGGFMPDNGKGRLLTPSTVWRELADKPEVENERFVPGDDRLIAEELGKKWVNVWRAPTVKPAPGNPHAVKLIRKHILHLANGDRRMAAIVMDWLAYGVQNPGKKINWALMFVGPQGCGKDTLFEIMQRVYDGEDRQDGGNARLVENLELGKGRNAFVATSQLVYVPEIKSDDRNGLGNILKTLITGKAATVDEKYVAAFKAPNRANFMAAANQLSAVPVEKGDRRFFVLIVERKLPAGYFKRLRAAFLSDSGAAAWGDYLLRRDLSAFNAGGEAPESPHKGTAIEATRNGVDAWLAAAIENRYGPFERDVVSITDALAEISKAGSGAPKMTAGQLSNYLRDNGGRNLGLRRVGKDVRLRLWAVRDAALVEAHKDLEALWRGHAHVSPISVVRTGDDGQTVAEHAKAVREEMDDAAPVSEPEAPKKSRFTGLSLVEAMVLSADIQAGNTTLEEFESELGPKSQNGFKPDLDDESLRRLRRG